MQSMGQHWMYDLEAAPSMSWVSGNMLPVVPMYHAPGADKEGQFNAFFFTAPLAQGPDNKGTDSAYTWDNVPSIMGGALPTFAMCDNFCNGQCSTSPIGHNPWEQSGTTHWATFHVFFNADPKDHPTCPGYSLWDNIIHASLASIMMGRTCPDNTAALRELYLSLIHI
eukprot:TRINITY_DN26345_c0_g1_i1.p3 TRINITY_DN26345_c0_g1~~TRINITY_DN26345_c0_g1_i1.p3  ORF type:complete len:168 (+),score=53.83 TRINITY_DN26345_c0_g1_i1:205-708(+)